MSGALGQAWGTEAAPGYDLRAAGERIEVLLEASSAHGVIARERSEELVRLVADLYGAGLERVLDILYDAGHLDADVLGALAADDLVASLLMVHGLHPHDVVTRVERALEDVRPYLGSHGGDVELLGVSADGVVRLRLLGSCNGCASSSVTLKLAVEGAVAAAAPEVTGIEVETPPADPVESSVIPVTSLRARLERHDEVTSGGWQPLPDASDVAAGEVRSLLAGGVPVVIARVGSELYAYQDQCPRCEGPLGGAALERRLAAAIGEAVLRCPACRAHYDVRRAGACLDDMAGAGDGLLPLPLLVQDGLVSVAVPATAGDPGRR